MITNHHLDGAPIGETPRCDDTYKIYSNAKLNTNNHPGTDKPYYEGALGQIQRDLWEMRKDYKTDQLVWEQDLLTANRRIERIEKSMTQGTERTNREQSWYCLQERIEALEDGMKLWAGKSSQDGIATSFVKDAWRKDINERIEEIEKRMEDVHTRITGCCNALDCKCAGLEDRTDGLQMDKADKAAIEKYSGRLIEERVRSLENANENNSRFALDIRIQLSQLQNAVASLKLLIPPPQPPCPQEDNNWDCVQHSAYPCKDRDTGIDVTQCIYYDKGVCDYKRKLRKRPEDAKHEQAQWDAVKRMCEEILIHEKSAHAPPGWVMADLARVIMETPHDPA
jgi:hypothetical protein